MTTCPFAFLSCVGLSQADQPEPVAARREDEQSAADHPRRLEPRLAIVTSVVGVDDRCSKVKVVDHSEIDPSGEERGLAFRFVVGCASAHLCPHLYAYIKGRCKGEGSGGMVNGG